DRRKGRLEREVDGSMVSTDASDAWDASRASASLPDRLARRLALATDGGSALPSTPRSAEPDWQEVAAGSFFQLLATDHDRHRISMLVRLPPGTAYPPHRHAEFEQLHLLDGELRIDERKLRPGDCTRSEAGSEDERVWSETGCTCLLITSTLDVLV